MKITTSKIANLIIWLQIYFNIISMFLIYDIGFPDSITFINDLLTLLLFLLYLYNMKGQVRLGDKYKTIILFMLGFVLVGSFSAIINGTSVLLYAWALRNTCRFFLWFYCCIHFMDYKYLKKNIKRFYFFNYINTAAIIYQYFFMGLRFDELNGFFGTYIGGNATINTFFIVVTIIVFVFYFENYISLKQMLGQIISMLIASSLNELKIYYIELPLIIFLYIVISNRLNKQMVLKIMKMVIPVIVIMFLSLQLLYIIYPGFRGFFSTKTIIDYSLRSYNSNTVNYVGEIPIMNRLSAFDTIRNWFLTKPENFLIGIGMGNAEYSNLGLLTSSFYRSYGEVNYLGYSYAYIFIENGLIGVFAYAGIFISNFLNCFKFLRKKDKGEIRVMYEISGCIAIMCLLLCVYNSCLRIETSGYIIFTFMVLPFAFYNNQKDT